MVMGRTTKILNLNRIVCLSLLLCVLFFSFDFVIQPTTLKTLTVFADTIEDSIEDTTDNENEIEEVDKSLAENWSIKIVVGIADSILKAFESVGMHIDQLVFGSSSPYLFKFEPGNIFAMISVRLYAIFRGYAFMAMFTILSIIGIRIMLQTGKSSDKANFKALLSTYTLSFLLLFFLPNLLDIFLDVRDSALKSVSGSMLDMFSGESNSYTGALRQIAVSEEGRLFDALMYLGSAILNIWFAFAYASISLSMSILFFFFPLADITMNGNKLKSVINNWFKEMFNLAMVPVFDAGLLLFPLGALSLDAPPLVTLFLTAMVIPSRTIIRSLFGIGGGVMEMAGIGFLMTAGGFARSAIGNTANLFKSFSDGFSDMNQASYYEKMANLDSNSIAGNFTSNNGVLGSSLEDYSNSIARTATMNPVDYRSNLSMSPMLREEDISTYDQMRREIVREHMNASWLSDSDLSKELSYEDKVELYRTRGLKKMAKSIGGFAGGFAATSGAVLGSWWGPEGLAMGTLGGYNVGTSIGGFIGENILVDFKNLKQERTGIAATNGNSQISAMSLYEATRVPSNSEGNKATVSGTIEESLVLRQEGAMGIHHSINMSDPKISEIVMRVSSDPIILEQAELAGLNAGDSYIKQQREQFIQEKIYTFQQDHAGEMPSPQIINEINQKADEYIKRIDIQQKANEVAFKASFDYQVDSVIAAINKEYSNFAGTDTFTQQFKEIADQKYEAFKSTLHEDSTPSNSEIV